MTEPPEQYIKLSLSGFRNALFGWEEHWGERCLSVTNVEADSFHPRRVPLEVARLLHKNDPNETVFKIFFYPNHAEVWHVDHWKLSASYRFSLTCAAALRRQKHDANSAAERAKFERLQFTKNKVIELFPALAHSEPRGLIEFCRSLWLCPRDHEFFVKFPALLSILDYEPTRCPDSSNQAGPSTGSDDCQPRQEPLSVEPGAA